MRYSQNLNAFRTWIYASQCLEDTWQVWRRYSQLPCTDRKIEKMQCEIIIPNVTILSISWSVNPYNEPCLIWLASGIINNLQLQGNVPLQLYQNAETLLYYHSTIVTLVLVKTTISIHTLWWYRISLDFHNVWENQYLQEMGVFRHVRTSSCDICLTSKNR